MYTFDTPLHHDGKHHGDLRVSFSRSGPVVSIRTIRFIAPGGTLLPAQDFTWFIQDMCPHLHAQLQRMAQDLVIKTKGKATA